MRDSMYFNNIGLSRVDRAEVSQVRNSSGRRGVCARLTWTDSLQVQRLDADGVGHEMPALAVCLSPGSARRFAIMLLEQADEADAAQTKEIHEALVEAKERAGNLPSNLLQQAIGATRR